MQKIISVAAIFFFICIVLVILRTKLTSLIFSPRQLSTINSQPTIVDHQPSIIASDLKIPWEIVFLPDSSMLVTERPGTLLRIDTEKQVIQEIEGVRHIGEGGLLGMTIHPNFTRNGWLYLYSTTTSASGGLVNIIERYTFKNNKLTERKTIFAGIAGSSNHDGGRIAFGPDGYLYITTGDAENPNSAQDTQSLNGKILRIRDDGTIPTDNPFKNAVYSFGHRNPQGIAWDKDGRLWETEHGPSGLQSGYDEVNLIEKGKNYGWPVLRGDEKQIGMVSPIIQSGSTDTWAPAGMVILNNDIYFTGLRGQTLYKAQISRDGQDRPLLKLKKYLQKEYGRLRAIRLGPDGALHISTSNTDGRGEPQENDDKIVQIPLEILR